METETLSIGSPCTESREHVPDCRRSFPYLLIPLHDLRRSLSLMQPRHQIEVELYGP